MYLIVGLGNIGQEYVNTRHNIGFQVVEKFAQVNGIDLNKLKFNSIYGQGNINGKKIFIMKPTTYMNRSGLAVAELSSYYKIPLKNIIVVTDDIDIPFASVRIRQKGSAGSHNGLKSLVNSLGSKDFPRIKIGVGKKHPKQDLASFVLGKFSKEEQPYIEEIIDITIKAIEEIIYNNIDSAMNKYNNKGARAQE